METEKQLSLVTTSHTNTPQIQTEKRSRKEVSPLVIEVLAEEFQFIQKRTKTSHTTDLLK
jgi:hypothetical protein